MMEDNVRFARDVDDPNTVYVIEIESNGNVHIETWIDHRFNGSGASNWIVETETGERLDLEFCSSVF